MKKFWERLVKANPSLQEESTKMTISVRAFKKQIEKAYKEGAADRAEVAKALKEIKIDNRDSTFDSFSKMFGL